MDCAKANEMMLEFVEGVLDDDACRELKEHVAECSACMMQLEKQSSRTRILQALGPVSAPEDLAGEISTSIRQTDSWYFVKRYGIPAGIVAAVVALILIAIALGMAVFQ